MKLKTIQLNVMINGQIAWCVHIYVHDLCFVINLWSVSSINHLHNHLTRLFLRVKYDLDSPESDHITSIIHSTVETNLPCYG